MKKTYISIIVISFLIILFAISCSQPNKESKKNSLSPSPFGNVDTPQNQSTEELFDHLLASFGEDWIEREVDPTFYPEYYGGAFISNDGTFVVAVTSSPEEHKKQLKEILGTDNFRVEKVQYSYRQMMRVMDSIDAFMMNSAITEDHPLMTRFAGAHPDVMANRVIVLLTQVDDATIRAFQKDVVDSPLIKFEKGDLPDGL